MSPCFQFQCLERGFIRQNLKLREYGNMGIREYGNTGIWKYGKTGIFCSVEVVHHVHRVKVGQDRYPDGHFTRTALRTWNNMRRRRNFAGVIIYWTRAWRILLSFSSLFSFQFLTRLSVSLTFVSRFMNSFYWKWIFFITVYHTLYMIKRKANAGWALGRGTSTPVTRTLIWWKFAER